MWTECYVFDCLRIAINFKGIIVYIYYKIYNKCLQYPIKYITIFNSTVFEMCLKCTIENTDITQL